MKKSTLVSVALLLGVAIVGLAIWLYMSIMTPVKFDNEYTKRRDACAEKLKAIRTLEEAYKITYGKYCGSFDTLFNRLINEDSMVVISKVVNTDIIPADVDINEMTELDAVKKGYITRKEVYINPIAKLREDKKLMTTAADGSVHPMTDQEILNLRYVPYPKDRQYDFTLQAGQIDKGGYMVPVFQCSVAMTDLLSDLDHQLVVNKLSELDRAKRYPGWKVGDMNQALTDGNFE
ncbi:MAG: hypothetical protein AUK63_609 [bacterium P3]|nr:MAG: hypothetical protein AUK63_609 [bacterium P3]KWW42065.1 MAG: hypothetical protein F083_716 [bacterium F083]